MDRRYFLKCSAFLGGSLAASHFLVRYVEAAAGANVDWAALAVGDAYSQYLPENQIYSVCQQCNTQCGIKVKFVDGVVAKIDGNPYSPWTMTPRSPTRPPSARRPPSRVPSAPRVRPASRPSMTPTGSSRCLNGPASGAKTSGRPSPSTRPSARSSTAATCSAKGKVEGLKDICVLRDPKIAKELAEDAAQVADKKMDLAAFKAKHAANLKYLIDPDHPDLGPKNNQFVFNSGRLKAGRDDLLKRFVNGALGTENKHGHTTVCQGSLYFTCKAMSDQFVEGKFGDGSKFYWQGDTGNAEFILFVGANPYEANYGPPLRCGRSPTASSMTAMKIAVVDPRCSKTAARAWKWLPVRPNGVAAVGMGMMHWIIENQRYDARYLANANKAAAKADNEPTWTQAAWLVKINAGRHPGALPAGLGPGPPQGKAAQEKRRRRLGIRLLHGLYRRRTQALRPQQRDRAGGRRPAGGHRN